MNYLEPIEWTQYWAENCVVDGPRALMIGDSISVGYRGPVFQRVKEKYNCVTISTSKAIDYPSFLPEIRFIAREEGFDYKVVHFNNGLHGWRVPDDEYAAKYEEAVKFLIDEFKGAKIILAATTPVTVNGNPAEYDELNAQAVRRNDIMFALAKKYSLATTDLYSAVYDRPELRSPDGYHYNGQGYEVLADVVAAEILKG